MNAYLLYSPLHYCCLTLIRSLPGLGNISICANFRGLGKYWILSIALNIIVISLIAFGGRFFMILPLIRSVLGALLFFVSSSSMFLSFFFRFSFFSNFFENCLRNCFCLSAGWFRCSGCPCCFLDSSC